MDGGNEGDGRVLKRRMCIDGAQRGLYELFQRLLDEKKKGPREECKGPGRRAD